MCVASKVYTKRFFSRIILNHSKQNTRYSIASKIHLKKSKLETIKYFKQNLIIKEDTCKQMQQERAIN